MVRRRTRKTETTSFQWCINDVQPSINNFIDIAKLLKVDVKELRNSTKK